MSEPTTSQTVTITGGHITVIAACALVVAAMVASVTLAVSIITHDRVMRVASDQDTLRQRVELLEAYEHSRRTQQQ